MKHEGIKGMLVDVGGVMMSNGWDRKLRQKVAAHFSLDYADFNERHALFNEILELGKISFPEYLSQVIFTKKREFTIDDVITYIKDALQPFPDMLELFRHLKREYGIKIGILSNESREFAIDRFKKIPVQDFVDYFLVSSFVGMRKPNPEIYELALDLLQIPIEKVIYVDDRAPFTEFATTLGIKSICHSDKQATEKAFISFFQSF